MSPKTKGRLITASEYAHQPEQKSRLGADLTPLNLSLDSSAIEIINQESSYRKHHVGFNQAVVMQANTPKTEHKPS